MQWLTEKNYFVFDNVSGLGPCDVIAMDKRGKIIIERLINNRNAWE